MKCAIEMGSGGVIQILSFMKTGAGCQAILWFCLRNLRGRNIGITGGTNL
jgi:hypothetical protein